MRRASLPNHPGERGSGCVAPHFRPRTGWQDPFPLPVWSSFSLECPSKRVTWAVAPIAVESDYHLVVSVWTRQPGLYPGDPRMETVWIDERQLNREYDTIVVTQGQTRRTRWSEVESRRQYG